MKHVSRTLLIVPVFLAAVILLGTSASAPSSALPAPILSPDGDDAECFTVLVGKSASADGTVMVAHNEDDRGEIIVNVRKIKPRDGAPQKVPLGTGAVHETDGKAAGFLWIEATTQEFADSFVNDHGVLVTSDSCPSRVTAEDYTEGGIGWMLRRLVAEQATSARDAVRRAGALVEQYGYRASGRTYSIADKNEAWMMAILRGRHWVAQRVPDDEVAVIPNHFTIRAVDLADTDRFMGSPDIVEYATKNGWYDPAKDGPFDFKKAFERPSAREPAADGNVLRHWRGLTLITGRAWELKPGFPFSVKPSKKMSAEQLRAILRDHYEGTEYDATDGYRTGTPNATKFRTICTASTINAFVASLRATGHPPLSVLVWLAFGKPDTTVFLPFYSGVETMPRAAGVGPDMADYEVFRQQHFEGASFQAVKAELLNTKVLTLEKLAEADYGRMHQALVKELFPLEIGFAKAEAKFEKDFSVLYAKDKAKGQRKLDEYVAAAFEKVADATDKLVARSAVK